MQGVVPLIQTPLYTTIIGKSQYYLIHIRSGKNQALASTRAIYGNGAVMPGQVDLEMHAGCHQ